MEDLIPLAPVDPAVRAVVRAALAQKHFALLSWFGKFGQAGDPKTAIANDLIAAGYLAPTLRPEILGGGLDGKLAMTIDGRIALAERTQMARQQRQPHRDLLEEAAEACLGPGIVLKSPTMGPQGSAIPDVLWLSGAHKIANWQPTVLEIKASRADALADIRAGKWRKYRPFAERIYFAAPEGALESSDIPDGCGLFLKIGTGWQRAKRARKHAWKMDRDILAALLLHMGWRSFRLGSAPDEFSGT